MTKTKDILIALFGGVLLALMITSNSILAQNTNAVFASWIAHGIGTCVIIIIFVFFYAKKMQTVKSQKTTSRIKWWLYLGGVPGAFVVILSSFVISKGFSLSNTISLILVGQILFGLFSDRVGLFGSLKRKFELKDFIVVFFVVTGTFLILFWK